MAFFSNNFGKDAARLQNLHLLAARLCNGGVHPVERIVIDGPGRAVYLMGPESEAVWVVEVEHAPPPDGLDPRRPLLRLDLEDPSWMISEEGRIEWRAGK